MVFVDAEIVGGLCDAVKKLLEALDIDGTCQVCEQSFKFHAVWCPLHEVHIALDKVESERHGYTKNSND